MTHLVILQSLWELCFWIINNLKQLVSKNIQTNIHLFSKKMPMSVVVLIFFRITQKRQLLYVQGSYLKWKDNYWGFLWQLNCFIINPLKFVKANKLSWFLHVVPTKIDCVKSSFLQCTSCLSINYSLINLFHKVFNYTFTTKKQKQIWICMDPCLNYLLMPCI